MEASGECEIVCPCAIVCGTKDAAGSFNRYGRQWAQRTGIPLFWIEDAGHNSDTDSPGEMNAIINDVVDKLGKGTC